MFILISIILLQLTKSTEVKVDKKLSTNKDSESEENSEAESGDDAEAEYLMEFEQTKKLQVPNSKISYWL